MALTTRPPLLPSPHCPLLPPPLSSLRPLPGSGAFLLSVKSLLPEGELQSAGVITAPTDHLFPGRHSHRPAPSDRLQGRAWPASPGAAPRPPRSGEHPGPPQWGAPGPSSGKHQAPHSGEHPGPPTAGSTQATSSGERGHRRKPCPVWTNELGRRLGAQQSGTGFLKRKLRLRKETSRQRAHSHLGPPHVPAPRPHVAGDAGGGGKTPFSSRILRSQQARPRELRLHSCL